MAGACDFLPPFSFCAAIISCLLRSASSRAFFFSRASASLLCSHHFLPLALSIFKGLLLFKSLSFSLVQPSFLASCAQHLQGPSSFQEPQLLSCLPPPFGASLPLLSSAVQVSSPAQL